MSPRKNTGSKKRPYRKTHPRWGAQSTPITPTIEDLVPSAVRARLLRIQAVRIHDGVAWRPPTNPKARHSSIVYGPTCQHPKSRALGECQLKSIGEFEIPPEYHPHIRHTDQADIPRPRALLCRQHRSMVEGFKSGKQISGNSHEAWCDICNHPDQPLVERSFNSWLHFAISTDLLLMELSVSHRAFYTHAGYFNLFEERAKKNNRLRALGMAAERGLLSNKGHTVGTGIKAIEAMGKIESEDKVRRMEVDVNHGGVVGLAPVNLHKLSDTQFAELLESFAKKARELADSDGPKQLSAPPQTIDLPREAIRVVSNEEGD